MLVDAAAMPSGAASAADMRYLGEALKEAQRAGEAGEVPVGAVIVLTDRIIARGHNQTEQLTDATAHAEMICLTAAMAHLRSKYLPDCTLYVTLEPCVMCAGALRWAQVGRVVFGASDAKFGYRTVGPLLHPKTDVLAGILAEPCAQLLTDFFRARRR
jgi:tRNA(adenine34) deaminase